MKHTIPRHFVDCEEIAPGVWCAPEEAARLKAQGPAIADANPARRSLDSIPSIGSPFEFWAILIALIIVAALFA